MTVFWLVAACLLGAALLFVVPPLFLRKKDYADIERGQINVSIYKNQLEELDIDLAADDISQEQFDKSRQEIERRVLEDTAIAEQGEGKSGKGLSIATAVVAALAVPLVSVLLYDKLGNPAAIDPQVRMAQPEASPHGDETNIEQQIEMMVSKLAQRLQDNPQDLEGWVMLGRSMSVLGRYEEAMMAYERAVQFAGDDATVLTDYADSIAMATGESLEGRPMELLLRALTIDPNNQKALWLAGTGLFERGDFAGAIEHWEHLRSLLPPGSEDIEVMHANITEAKSYLERQQAGEFGQAPAQQHLSDVATTAKAAVTAQVKGRVSIAADLAGKFADNDTLFIFARAANGPPMPLAIIRATASELPLEFSLDEGMAMMPSMSLAKFSEVVVGARISKTGNAMPQSGDLQGATAAVAVGSEGLEIVIDTVVP